MSDSYVVCRTEGCVYRDQPIPQVPTGQSPPCLQCGNDMDVVEEAPNPVWGVSNQTPQEDAERGRRIMDWISRNPPPAVDTFVGYHGNIQRVPQPSMQRSPWRHGVRQVEVSYDELRDVYQVELEIAMSEVRRNPELIDGLLQRITQAPPSSGTLDELRRELGATREALIAAETRIRELEDRPVNRTQEELVEALEQADERERVLTERLRREENRSDDKAERALQLHRMLYDRDPTYRAEVDEDVKRRMEGEDG